MKRLAIAALLLIAACEETIRPPNGLPRAVVVSSPTMGDIFTVESVVKIQKDDGGVLRLFTIDGAGNEVHLTTVTGSQWRWE